MAGAVFGEVGASLFVAGAALREILIDSRSAKCCFFHTKCISKVGRGRSPRRRVRDDDLSSDYRRIIVGLSSDYRQIIVGLSSECRRIVFLLVLQFMEFPLKS